MSAPDPDQIGLGKQLLEWAWLGVMALGTFIFKGVKDEITKKTNKEAFDHHVKENDREIVAIKEELSIQRVNASRLFEKIEEVGDKTEVRFTAEAERAHRRHVELLGAINEVGKGGKQ